LGLIHALYLCTGKDVKDCTAAGSLNTAGFSLVYPGLGSLNTVVNLLSLACVLFFVLLFA
jgi:hypothetical protein